MAFYDDQGNEIINVTLKNSKGSKTAPYTTAEQVEAVSLTNSEETVRLDDLLAGLYGQASGAYNLANRAYSKADEAYDEATNAYCKACDAYDKATSAYNRADDAYSKASEAYSEATNAYNRASSAYSLASTNSGYLNDVKTIFSNLAGTMYNPGDEDSMGYIYGGNPTVTEISDDLVTAWDQANNAYNIACAAYHVAGSIYNYDSGYAADGYSAGTYLLKATVKDDYSVEFEWVNEADYKNA